MTKAKSVVVGSAIFIGALGVVLFGIRSCVISATEFTETKMKITNLTGADIEVTDTQVDAIAHYEYVSVYIHQTGESKFAELFHRRTLLFQYDPWSYDSPLPSISSPGPGNIQISVPKVSSIFFKKGNWENLTVDYKIGSVEYP